MPDYLTRGARQTIHDVMARTGMSRTDIINRAIVAYGASEATGGEVRGETRPRLPEPTAGRRTCDEPLYDFEGRAIVGYCTRTIRRGSHRGLHRIEWSDLP